jgi:hypothetical protein
MENSGNHGLGLFFGIYGIICCFWLVLYVYVSYCLMKIAKKLNVENAWLAWIPIVNLWIVVQCAGKEWWWIILMFIPIVGYVVNILLWMAMCERRGKASGVGLLMILPPLGYLILPGYLAFSD